MLLLKSIPGMKNSLFMLPVQWVAARLTPGAANG
jgi:hypothetical protein